MHIGIIGYGSIGARHYQNLRNHPVQITVLTKRRDVPGLPAVHSWAPFAKRGPFAALFITNDTAKHLATIRRCLPLRPRALFVEKPMSHTSVGLRDVAARLQRRAISCWIGYNLQFFRPLIRIKQVVDSGRLGMVYSVRVSVGQDLREWRTRDYRAGYSSHARRGGGVLRDLVHDLNYPAWLLGEELRAVAAIITRRSALTMDVEDCAESLLRTPSGITVSLHQDYLRRPGKRSLEIIAQRGTLEWDTLTNTIRVWVGARYQEAHVVVDRNAMYREEVAFFLRKLRAGRYFSNTAAAVRDVELIDALHTLGHVRGGVS